MAYLEPCCIEQQLPRAVKAGKGSALFQTNGDVTIEKLMQAACCMASGGFGEYWICIREVDVVLMRFLRRWMQRGWIRELRLLTVGDQRDLVASELGDELMAHVEYGWREDLGTEAFCVVGDRESMVVQGEMLLAARTEARMTAYSAAVGPNARMLGSEGAVGSMVENLRAVLRLQKRKVRRKKEDAVGTVPAVAEVADDSTEGLSPSVSSAPEEPKSAEEAPPKAVETSPAEPPTDETETPAAETPTAE